MSAEADELYSLLVPLADELDFIAIHTYPAWEYRSIHDALEYTKQNYHAVVDHYPGKTVVITEAGWTTAVTPRRAIRAGSPAASTEACSTRSIAGSAPSAISRWATPCVQPGQ